MEIKRINTFINGWVGAIHLDDGKKIETTSTCLPSSTEIRKTKRTINSVEEIGDDCNYWFQKWMIGVSTQSGCPIYCKFCAVNKVTEKYGFRNLSSIEIANQVELAITKTKEVTRLDLDPKKTKTFRVLFTRMGEPSLNIANVIGAIRLIKTKYPNARVQISTIGTKKSRELIDELLKIEDEFGGSDWLELQFSIHSTDNKFRKWLQSPTVLSNEEINTLGEYFFYAKDRKWKTTLNFALSTRTPFDVDVLKKQFNSKVFFVKISPINENIVSDENKLKTKIEYKNSI